jgi:hypothetical protein
VTSEYDVPLMVTRGFSSETFAFNAIEARENDKREAHYYYLGDFDRSGVDAANSLKEKLSRFINENDSIPVGWEYTFEMLAVTEEQIHALGLSTREPKRKTAADKAWPHDSPVSLMPLMPIRCET